MVLYSFTAADKIPTDSASRGPPAIDELPVIYGRTRCTPAGCNVAHVGFCHSGANCDFQDGIHDERRITKFFSISWQSVKLEMQLECIFACSLT